MKEITLSRNIILSIIIFSILASSAFAQAGGTDNGTTKMSKSFLDAVAKGININTITSASYSGTTNACISCHNDTGFPVDTDGNGIAAPYKRPHNDTVMCEYCHGSNPHSVKYIQPDGTLGTDKTTAATCIDCHQTGTVGANNPNFASAYVLGNILHHSNDPNNGSLWTRPGDAAFWSNQLTACLYCHNNTKHDIIALGKPSIFKDTNVVRQFGTWCESCHQQGYGLYSTMLGVMNLIPPEITGHATYGNYPGNPKYFLHNGIGSFQDTTCKGCHGNRANVTALMHNVSSGQSGPDCVSCHDVSAGVAPALINESAMSQTDSIHKDLNKDAVTSLDPRNKKCWSCHGDGTEPAQHPSTYKNPATCTDCHAGSNTNFNPPDTILKVSEHYWNGEQIITSGVSSCYKCHNKSEMMIAANDPDQGTGAVNGGANGGNNSTSHYGKKRNDLLSIKDTKQYCNYCHNSTTSPSTSFFDVFIDINNNNIQNHSAYGTNPKCQDCHQNGRIHNASLEFATLTLPNSTFCLTCHGPSGTASIKDKNKHNDTVNCSICHLGTGKDIHPIKYLSNTGGLSLNKEEGIKCTYCHESGNYGAPAIGKLQHSVNPWNGSLWNEGRPSKFWDNNSIYTACQYCHGDTKHNTSAIGKITEFKGSNIKNVFGDWCGICHYQINGRYNNMVGKMQPLVAPEITKNSTYGIYTANRAKDGTYYFNHSLEIYNDNECGRCHYSETPPNLTKLMHTVKDGSSSCLACHSTDVDTTRFGRHTDISTTEGSNIVSDNDCKVCHFGVQTIDKMVAGYANYSNTLFCQDCHASGGRDGGPAYYNSMNPSFRKSNMPPGHAQAKCETCHIAGDDEILSIRLQNKYHPNGPKGTATGKNCFACHYRTNGDPYNPANIGLNDPPFNAPGERHDVCENCHPGSPRPLLTECGLCHGAAENHNVGQDGHAGNSNPQISGVTVTTPVNPGNVATVNATVTAFLVQIAKAQYNVTDSSGSEVRSWTEMSASDGRFDSKTENVVGSIDTTGLSGTYKVNVRGMASGYSGGAINHNPALPYYPNNGVWTSNASVTLTVTATSWGKIPGVSNAHPSITTFNNRLYAMVRGIPNGIYINSMGTDNIWSGWNRVDGATFTDTGPSISTFNGRLYTAVIGTDNSIYINSMGTNDMWSGWTWAPGASYKSPSIATFNNRLYNMVAGTDGNLYIRSMGTDNIWSGWSMVGGISNIGPSISEFNNRLYATVVGTDNSIYVNSMGTDGIWSGWTRTPGASYKDPSIATFNNRLYEMVVGTDGNLYIRSTGTDNIWSGWNIISSGTIPGVLTGPSIFSFNNNLDAMVIGTDNGIYINNNVI